MPRKQKQKQGQVQAQKQSVTVNIVQEKKAKRKPRKTTKPKPKEKEPTAYDLARPVAVYTTASSGSEYGGLFRDLLATVNTIQQKQNEMSSFVPTYARRLNPVEMVSPEVAMVATAETDPLSAPPMPQERFQSPLSAPPMQQGLPMPQGVQSSEISKTQLASLRSYLRKKGIQLNKITPEEARDAIFILNSPDSRVELRNKTAWINYLSKI